MEWRRIMSIFMELPAPRTESLRSWSAHHLDSRNIIRVGILLLIATPIMRVAYCVYGFTAQKDKIYIVVSSIVLTVLLYSSFTRSLLASRGGGLSIHIHSCQGETPPYTLSLPTEAKRRGGTCSFTFGHSESATPQVSASPPTQTAGPSPTLRFGRDDKV